MGGRKGGRGGGKNSEGRKKGGREVKGIKVEEEEGGKEKGKEGGMGVKREDKGNLCRCL